jgi:hypothetical protein
MNMKSSVLAIAMVSITGMAMASLTYTGPVEASIGSGGNVAAVVIDFDANNTFVFEYRWEGAATGWDALYALSQNSALEIDYQFYGEWGAYVKDLSCPGSVKYNYADDGSLGWAYYYSNDNQNWAQGETVSFRELTNGSWDAWVWTNHDMDNYWLPIRQPGQSPIPEPSTMFLLGLGVAVLRHGRKQ